MKEPDTLPSGSVEFSQTKVLFVAQLHRAAIFSLPALPFGLTCAPSGQDRRNGKCNQFHIKQ